MEYNTSDIIGSEVGLLTVQKLVETKRYATRFRYFYRCTCKCGREKVIERHNLTGKKPHTTSCGCLRRRAAAESPSWSGHGEISGRHWASIKRHAVGRSKAFTVSIDEAWKLYEEQNGRCALTGMELSLRSAKHNGHYHYIRTASLDRKDSTRGYEKDNVHWVHKDINQMKWDMPQDRFIELCRKVAEHAA